MARHGGIIKQRPLKVKVKEKGGKITTFGRRKLKPSQFALPGRRFPIDTKARARNALARAAQGLKAGRLTTSQVATIKRKVKAKFPDIKVNSKKK